MKRLLHDPRVGQAIFSLNSFVAALLALWIGFSIGLPRPYWAMLTVYITAQPLTGALRSKALYRVLGTALGGAAAVVLVPPLVDAPELLSLALAGWAGLCLYLSLLDRTPRAYVFMLAGYTSAIIAFPSVNAPDLVFETALARVEEITLGIMCATVVHSVVFPRDVAAALSARVGQFLGDAQRWIAEALEGLHGPEERARRQRLASDVTDLQLLSTHLPFDTSNLRPRTRAVRALQDRLAILLPLVSGVEDRLDVLRGLRGLSPELDQLVADIVAWARDGTRPRDEASALQARCAALTPELGQGGDAPDWSALLRVSALERVGELIGALQESRDLAAFMRAPSRTPPHLDPLVRARARRPLHRDRGLALLSAFALVVAVLGCCASWILLAWPEGSVAAMMAAVFSSFYATQDDPAPALVGFLSWTLVALLVAAAYLFAILPAIDGFPMLALALAPSFLFLGYLQGDPIQVGRAMPLLIGLAGALSLQETFDADFPSFINGNLAQLIGIGSALAATRVFRTVGSGWSARRILRRGWRDLADLAAARRRADRSAWTSAMLDRLGLITPRLALAGPDAGLDAADALNDLRIGLNVIDLRLVQRELAPATGGAVERVLASVARLFRRRARGQAAEPEADLLVQLDRAIGELQTAQTGFARRRGFAALTGLRRNLFPAAPPFASDAEAAA